MKGKDNFESHINLILFQEQTSLPLEEICHSTREPQEHSPECMWLIFLFCPCFHATFYVTRERGNSFDCIPQLFTEQQREYP